MIAYAPTQQYLAADPTVLVDGDAGNAANINTPVKIALDRAYYAKGALWGQLTWTGRMAVSGTAAAPVVTLGPIEAVSLCDSVGTWRAYFQAGETSVLAASIEGGGALAASSWYYVYVWSDSAAPGAAKFQISLNPPTEAATPTVLQSYKRTCTNNYRYLGCFPTDAAGNPIVTRKYGHRYTFETDHAGAAALLIVMTAGSAAAWTAAACAALVPPYARVARILGTIYDGAALNYLQVRATGAAAGFRIVAACPIGGAAGPCAGETDVMLSAAQSLEYQLAAATGVSNIYVTGFEE